MSRTAQVKRDTKETQITVNLKLDGTGAASLKTGIGFLTICWMDLQGMGFLIWR